MKRVRWFETNTIPSFLGLCCVWERAFENRWDGGCQDWWPAAPCRTPFDTQATTRQTYQDKQTVLRVLLCTAQYSRTPGKAGSAHLKAHAAIYLKAHGTWEALIVMPRAVRLIQRPRHRPQTTDNLYKIVILSLPSDQAQHHLWEIHLLFSIFMTM